MEPTRKRVMNHNHIPFLRCITYTKIDVIMGKSKGKEKIFEKNV